MRTQEELKTFKAGESVYVIQCSLFNYDEVEDRYLDFKWDWFEYAEKQSEPLILNSNYKGDKYYNDYSVIGKEEESYAVMKENLFYTKEEAEYEIKRRNEQNIRQIKMQMKDKGNWTGCIPV